MNFGSAMAVVSAIPTDWMIIGAFFIIVVADALRSGSIRAGALAISLPLSLFLFDMLPQTAFLDVLSAQLKTTIEQAVAFAVIEAAVFVCIHQMLLSFDRYTSLLSATISGLAATVVFLLIWIQVPALQSLLHFGPQIQTAFGAPYRFFWLIASYLALAFVGG